MKVSIREYSELKGITTAAVYKAVKEKRLEAVQEGKRKFIIIEEQEKAAETTPVKETNREVENLKLEVEYLKKLLEREAAEKEKAEHRELETKRFLEEELNRVHINFNNSIKALDYKEKDTKEILEGELNKVHKDLEEKEKELEKVKNKKWWQIFK